MGFMTRWWAEIEGSLFVRLTVGSNHRPDRRGPPGRLAKRICQLGPPVNQRRVSAADHSYNRVLDNFRSLDPQGWAHLRGSADDQLPHRHFPHPTETDGTGSPNLGDEISCVFRTVVSNGWNWPDGRLRSAPAGWAEFFEMDCETYTRLVALNGAASWLSRSSPRWR